MSDNKFVIEEATISDIDSLIMLRSELLDNSDAFMDVRMNWIKKNGSLLTNLGSKKK